MTTECLKVEMKQMDEIEPIGCFVASKRFEGVRLCKHCPSISSKECILDIISKNVNKFFIASNNSELKEQIRNIAGIPIILTIEVKLCLKIRVMLVNVV